MNIARDIELDLDKSDTYAFRLYVTANAPNSLLAIANLTAMCQRHLAGRHRIEVIDLWRDSQRALADGIMITPTLVKLSPGREVRIVGSLSDEAVVVAGLGLK
jgi:circadian clock protein KaiB